MNDREIKIMWVYLHEHWQQFDIPDRPEVRDVKVTVWRDTLGDLPFDLVRTAVVALGDRDHPPKPGQIRSTALDLQRRVEGGPRVPDVDEAWREVREAVQTVGRYSRPQFSHEAIAGAVAAVGWLELCNCENPDVIRGQFAKLYEAGARRTMRTTVAEPPALGAFFDSAIKRLGDGAG